MCPWKQVSVRGPGIFAVPGHNGIGPVVDGLEVWDDDAGSVDIAAHAAQTTEVHGAVTGYNLYAAPDTLPVVPLDASAQDVVNALIELGLITQGGEQ